MTSQLNVDTIVDKAGSGGTNVKVANNAVAVAEGGSATTNVVQGLCKAWFNMNGTGTPTNRDSFNIASITDNGTGEYSSSFTSSFDNADYAMGGWTGYPGSRGSIFGEDSTSGIAYATGSFTMETSYVSGTNGDTINMDVTYNNQMFMGDLA